jgi:hypothetical protein
MKTFVLLLLLLDLFETNTDYPSHQALHKMEKRICLSNLRSVPSYLQMFKASEKAFEQLLAVGKTRTWTLS